MEKQIEDKALFALQKKPELRNAEDCHWINKYYELIEIDLRKEFKNEQN